MQPENIARVTENAKRISELLTQVFTEAAEAQPPAVASTPDEDQIRDIIQGEIEDAVDCGVESALEDRLPYGELITAEDFDDYLRDSDSLSDFVTEDTVTDICTGLICDSTLLESTIMELIDEMRRDYKTDIADAVTDVYTHYDGQRLRFRLTHRINNLFTRASARLRSLASYRVSLRKG